ncbi:hypothetical protein P879_11941 [Paragonimus westermani]|uniref:Hexosyltransferase n=1 Tax=Paragonimus westermani TaxID=34504 RepID=A0A8T0D8U0_9TREM|nr:hypothetical protein P879_11941 [Paragonimus westermani]
MRFAYRTLTLIIISEVLWSNRIVQIQHTNILLKPKREWAMAEQQFHRRKQHWPQTIHRLFRTLERNEKLSSSDIRAVYSRCATQSSDLDPVALEQSEFTIGQWDFCSNKPHLKLIIVVHSYSGNSYRRNLIRSTWGSLGRVGEEKIGILYFIGQAARPEEQMRIEQENTIYRDLVQRNFTENYHNMTHKHLTVIEWLTLAECPWLDYVVKVDDDTFVDVFHLTRFLRVDRLKSTPGFYCTATSGAKPSRPHTDRQHNKWTITAKEFPKNIFPTYCEGFGYIIEAELVPYLYLCSLFTRPIWIDDVYVTGMLADNLGFKRQKFLPGHAYDRVGPKVHSEQLLNNIFLTCYHSEYLPETFRRLWANALTGIAIMQYAV